MKQFTLGKTERLKSRKQIERLFKEGKTITVTPFKIFYILEKEMITIPATSNLLFGIGAGTKHFKKAVDRNRIKRLVREAYRLQKNELKVKLMEKNLQLNVFFIYTGKELPLYSLVFEKTGMALQKFIKIADEIAETNT